MCAFHRMFLLIFCAKRSLIHRTHIGEMEFHSGMCSTYIDACEQIVMIPNMSPNSEYSSFKIHPTDPSHLMRVSYLKVKRFLDFSSPCPSFFPSLFESVSIKFDFHLSENYFLSNHLFGSVLFKLRTINSQTNSLIVKHAKRIFRIILHPFKMCELECKCTLLLNFTLEHTLHILRTFSHWFKRVILFEPLDLFEIDSAFCTTLKIRIALHSPSRSNRMGENQYNRGCTNYMRNVAIQHIDGVWKKEMYILWVASLNGSMRRMHAWYHRQQ